ncbi:MAG: nucleotidyl transferase AbiEii/AbiGii toxin family protein [Archangium sp.]|nr:nucleotidyl transferase AbiEii/AbiGii toxin family protein [Archangium sp.]
MVCGVPTLTAVDLVATKFLANSDRWADASVFSRDIIDLTMMQPTAENVLRGLAKARTAYGPSIDLDAMKAIRRLREQPDVLARCMTALTMTAPATTVRRRLSALAHTVKRSAPAQR